MSDICYADITNYLLLCPLYNWKTTNLVIFHLLESFQYQVIALDTYNLANKVKEQ